MPESLAKLENNEAVLMMYLADELSPTARAQVEHMLQHDPALRRSLEEMRTLQQGMIGTLDELEWRSASPAGEEASVRRLLRRLRRAQLEQAARQRPAPPAAKPLPRWASPLVAAAAAMFLLLALWGLGAFDGMGATGEKQISTRPPVDHQQRRLAGELRRSLLGAPAEELDEADVSLRALIDEGDELFSSL